jgi:hypothetical protein
MTMPRRWTLAILAITATLASCDLLDPARPMTHPDTEIFGNLIELEQVEHDGPAWLARVRVGMPRAFLEAEQHEGRPSPPLEEGLVADVLVTSDTVVLARGGGAPIESIALGSEVAVVPVVGTTRMIGTQNVTVEARYFADFESFRKWQLPGLARPDDVEDVRNDPDLINSDGIERAPLPLAGGKVLYFTARLRQSAAGGDHWLGAPRVGLSPPSEGEISFERVYRTELGDDGWTPPAPVIFDGPEDAVSVRLTWIDEEETTCLVTVEGPDGTWVGSAERSSPDGSWGSIERLPGFGDAATSDAQFLAGSRTKMVYAVQRLAGAPTDLWLVDPTIEGSPMPLQPEVNTPGAERSPRVGPANELFFTRGDRQFVLAAGELRPVVVPGPHRTVITEAAPTGDGKWVFACIPRFRPIELDQDIYVAPWLGEGRVGSPIPVDGWRP